MTAGQNTSVLSPFNNEDIDEGLEGRGHFNLLYFFDRSIYLQVKYAVGWSRNFVMDQISFFCLLIFNNKDVLKFEIEIQL